MKFGTDSTVVPLALAATFTGLAVSINPHWNFLPYITLEH